LHRREAVKVPAIHVYWKSASRTGQIIWSDGEDAVELTGLKVSGLKRVIREGDVPKVEVTFVARLVEHEPEEEAAT
jgi:hypothetical protein